MTNPRPLRFRCLKAVLFASTIAVVVPVPMRTSVRSSIGRLCARALLSRAGRRGRRVTERGLPCTGILERAGARQRTHLIWTPTSSWAVRTTGDQLPDTAAHRPAEVFAAIARTGKLQAVWPAKEQVRALLRTTSLPDAAAATEELKVLVEAASRPETNKLYRAVCRW